LYAQGHEVGLVLFGTKDTKNALNDKLGAEQYKNVTTFRHLDKIDLDFLRAVEGQGLRAEDKTTARGDLFDGLIVAMDMLTRHCGTKK
jgi:hypothetical protein